MTLSIFIIAMSIAALVISFYTLFQYEKLSGLDDGFIKEINQHLLTLRSDFFNHFDEERVKNKRDIAKKFDDINTRIEDMTEHVNNNFAKSFDSINSLFGDIAHLEKDIKLLKEASAKKKRVRKSKKQDE